MIGGAEDSVTPITYDDEMFYVQTDNETSVYQYTVSENVLQTEIEGMNVTLIRSKEIPSGNMLSSVAGGLAGAFSSLGGDTDLPKDLTPITNTQEQPDITIIGKMYVDFGSIIHKTDRPISVTGRMDYGIIRTGDTGYVVRDGIVVDIFVIDSMESFGDEVTVARSAEFSITDVPEDDAVTVYLVSTEQDVLDLQEQDWLIVTDAILAVGEKTTVVE